MTSQGKADPTVLLVAPFPSALLIFDSFIVQVHRVVWYWWPWGDNIFHWRAAKIAIAALLADPHRWVVRWTGLPYQPYRATLSRIRRLLTTPLHASLFYHTFHTARLSPFHLLQRYHIRWARKVCCLAMKVICVEVKQLLSNLNWSLMENFITSIPFYRDSVEVATICRRLHSAKICSMCTKFSLQESRLLQTSRLRPRPPLIWPLLLESSTRGGLGKVAWVFYLFSLQLSHSSDHFFK